MVRLRPFGHSACRFNQCNQYVGLPTRDDLHSPYIKIGENHFTTYYTADTIFSTRMRILIRLVMIDVRSYPPMIIETVTIYACLIDVKLEEHITLCISHFSFLNYVEFSTLGSIMMILFGSDYE
ncbi:hypothetical protein E3P94_01195 [Wallemia ichthyophaga]|nr:hypothetical protein E3P95_01063 [Wallemia ichthyophaga]TIB02923.1 hypothetical protein E3P94_01195 [Wallemia ichthyophaga]